MKEKKRLPTSGEPVAWTRPFAVLKEVALPPALEPRPGAVAREAPLIAPKKAVGGWISFARPHIVAARL